MKKIIILITLILFLGSCATSNQTYQVSSTIRPPLYVNSTSKANPYIKKKDKNSYEHSYKKHIKRIKRGIYK